MRCIPCLRTKCDPGRISSGNSIDRNRVGRIKATTSLLGYTKEWAPKHRAGMPPGQSSPPTQVQLIASQSCEPNSTTLTGSDITEGRPDQNPARSYHGMGSFRLGRTDPYRVMPPAVVVCFSMSPNTRVWLRTHQNDAQKRKPRERITL